MEIRAKQYFVRADIFETTFETTGFRIPVHQMTVCPCAFGIHQNDDERPKTTDYTLSANIKIRISHARIVLLYFVHDVLDPVGIHK